MNEHTEPTQRIRELWMFLLGVFYRSGQEQREQLKLMAHPSLAPNDLLSMFEAVDNNNGGGVHKWMMDRYRIGLGNGRKLDEAIADIIVDDYRRKRVKDIVAQAQFTQLQAPTEVLERLRAAVRELEELGIGEPRNE